MADIFLEVIQYRCVLNWLFSGAAPRQAVDFKGEVLMGSHGFSVELHDA
jgi:hypothetical protein